MVADGAPTRWVRAALAAVLFASVLTAQTADAQGAGARAEAPSSSAELVRPGLYRIPGGTLLRISAQGFIVVASSPVGAHGALMTEIQRVPETSGLPLRALVLTGAGPGQARTVAQFVEAGVPVIVQRGVVARLAADAAASGAAPAKPLISYDTDYLLRVGDVEVEIEHVGTAKTRADSIVLFRELRVVAVGDLFTAGTPEPDCAAGGSFAGWAAAIDHLMWSDFDVAVPSRGAPVGKRELVAFKAKLEALAGRASSSPPGRSDCRP